MDRLPTLSYPIETIITTTKCVSPLPNHHFSTPTQLFFHLLEQVISHYRSEAYSHYYLSSNEQKTKQLEFNLSKHTDVSLFEISQSSDIQFPMILHKKCISKILKNGLRKKQMDINLWMPKLLRISWIKHVHRPRLIDVWIDQFRMIVNHVRHLLFGSQLVRLNNATLEHVPSLER